MPAVGDGSDSRLADDLLSEAKRMYQSLLTEVSSERWSGCQDYILSYNTLLNRSYRIGLSTDIMPIRLLSPNELGTKDHPSSKEKEMIMEAMRNTLILCNALEKALSQPAFPTEEGADIGGALARVKTICERFHAVALYLQKGYQKRSGFLIKDEYDVQHLIRALMFLDFDAVDSEVYIPIYAGKQVRVDFLIERYGIAVETKMARTGLKEGQIGDELLLDIARYQIHQNVRYLVCFIYDPKNLIENPPKLVRDLQAKSTEDFNVIAVIRPRRF